jgi:myo-inositol catabolism protein IolC
MIADLWRRVWPWRTVLRDDWTELVAMNADLREQCWELSAEVAALKASLPAPRTRRKET